MTTNLPVPLDLAHPTLFIEHSVEGEVVPQRPTDGYVNATRLCQRSGKRFSDYHRLGRTKYFLKELSAETGIPVSDLIQVVRGGSDKSNQGSWVHPQVAIDLGQWLSPIFAVNVSKWVSDWMHGNTTPYMPIHIQRYLKNRSRIPHTHFSMLNEVYLNFLAPLEDLGVIPPAQIMPDISAGRMFSQFLREKGIDPSKFPTYTHRFTDESRPPIRARMYPIEHLADFRRYFHEVWLPERAEAYLKEHFPRALPFLRRLLPLSEAQPSQ